MKTMTKERKKFQINGKRYKGLLPNGTIAWNMTANRHCIALLDKHLHYSTISRETGLTPHQVAYRAKKKNKSVSVYRRGDSQEAQIIIRRFRIKFK
jgi:hypothetical protein